MKYSTYPWSQDSVRLGLVGTSGLVDGMPVLAADDEPARPVEHDGLLLPSAMAPVLTAATARAMRSRRQRKRQVAFTDSISCCLLPHESFLSLQTRRPFLRLRARRCVVLRDGQEGTTMILLLRHDPARAPRYFDAASATCRCAGSGTLPVRVASAARARRPSILRVEEGRLEAGLVLLGGDAGELAEDLHEVALARKAERRRDLARGQLACSRACPSPLRCAPA